MVDGLKYEISITYDFGVCGECKYTTQELVQDHPNGSHDQEATGDLIRAGQQWIMIVTPHRETCSQHTKQKEPTA
jgi:hypothetical protein